MQMSLHPPHVLRQEDKNSDSNHSNNHIINRPHFPFCYYSSDSESVGEKLDEYNEYYCNAFQPSFNEYGLCHTFNNPDVFEDLDNTFER